MTLSIETGNIGVRIVNFCPVTLPLNDSLSFDSNAVDGIVKEIRRYADLPVVFVCANDRRTVVEGVLGALAAIRSPCYPYALFLTDGDTADFSGRDLDVRKLDSADPDAVVQEIATYAASRFTFDPGELKIDNAEPLPESVDVTIVGAGMTGLYAAKKLMENNISVCVVDQSEAVGGIWSIYANDTSQVNTSEAAYRLVEKNTRSNRDHSTAREVLSDIAHLSSQLSRVVFLNTAVDRIAKSGRTYQVHMTRDKKPYTLESKGVILAVNDRVGAPRKRRLNDQERFKGKIMAGISNEARGFDWTGKNVVIAGMGAFAVENARTALEGGAGQVTVVCRRHGTVCPKIIDYLNFATPYDDAYRHDKKSNMRNMMFWKKLYNLSGATQPECWMGKVKHPGHTISVSDIWFIGHYLKKIRTITGSITGMFENGVIVENNRRIDTDVIVDCVGFHRNASAVSRLCGYTEVYNVNYLDKDVMYLADAYIDDDAFNSLFGSSVLEMVKFYTEVYIHYFDNPAYETMIASDGIEKHPVEDRKWSHYIAGAMALTKHDDRLRVIAKKQVDQRTANFLEAHDLSTYVAENKREWIDTHRLLAGKPLAAEDRLPYVFEKLAEKK